MADIKVGHLYAEQLSESDILELRNLADNTPFEMPWVCFWNDKRIFVEELQRFLGYYDNRPELRGQMAIEFDNGLPAKRKKARTNSGPSFE